MPAFTLEEVQQWMIDHESTDVLTAVLWMIATNYGVSPDAILSNFRTVGLREGILTLTLTELVWMPF